MVSNLHEGKGIIRHMVWICFKQNSNNVNNSRTSELLNINVALLLIHKKMMNIRVMLLCQAEREGTENIPKPG